MKLILLLLLLLSGCITPDDYPMYNNFYVGDTNSHPIKTMDLSENSLETGVVLKEKDNCFIWAGNICGFPGILFGYKF